MKRDASLKAPKGSAHVNVVATVIVAIVVIASVAALLGVRLSMGAATGADQLRALVHDGDGRVHELSLSQDSRTTITTGLGTNVVVVEGGTVRVEGADCENLDCVRQGRIDAPGRQIICLPHKLWIEVVVAGESSGRMDVETVDREDVDVTSR